MSERPLFSRPVTVRELRAEGHWHADAPDLRKKKGGGRIASPMSDRKIFAAERNLRRAARAALDFDSLTFEGDDS